RAAPPRPDAPGGAGGGALRVFDPGIEYHPLPTYMSMGSPLSNVVDLPDLIRAIGHITGRRFVLSGRVRSIRATIYSPTRVTAGEAYRAFLSVLDDNGYAVVPNGRYLRVEDTSVLHRPLPTYAAAEASAGDWAPHVTWIQRLRNVSADDAAGILERFRSRDGN